MLGPALGYIAGGQLLRLYVDIDKISAKEWVFPVRMLTQFVTTILANISFSKKSGDGAGWQRLGWCLVARFRHRWNTTLHSCHSTFGFPWRITRWFHSVQFKKKPWRLVSHNVSFSFYRNFLQVRKHWPQRRKWKTPKQNTQRTTTSIIPKMIPKPPRKVIWKADDHDLD